jgi:uncharacterized membrane protein
LGLGLGGFFDGIVLHQLLQWHHMLTSAGYPADTLRNLQINTLWDGIFHASTYVFVVVGLISLWKRTHLRQIRWSSKLLIGSLVLGFGIFNVVEGIIDHHLLGIHHLNETVAREQWVYWDVGFLIWGAAMILAGGHFSEAVGTKPTKADWLGHRSMNLPSAPGASAFTVFVPAVDRNAFNAASQPIKTIRWRR